MESRIPYTRPSITGREQAYATDAVANGWGEHCYDYINKFERAFASYVGVKHAVATSSCTGALHLGLNALGIGAGDEVIIADTTWIAAASAITYTGASPVFADIDPDSWCVTAETVRRRITPRTKAIVATHLYGNLCDMDSIQELGRVQGLHVVEDAAEALGSVYRGRRAGAMGTFGAFSFHGTKTLTTGEGGMLVTDDDAIFERVTMLNNHGRARSQTKQFWADAIGFKYRMSNVQAAIGLAQIERVEELVSRKRQIFRSYAERLKCSDHIALNAEADGTLNSYWMPTVVFSRESGVTREQLQAAFAAANIDARVFFWPVSGLPMFKPARDNVNSWDIPGRAINLPSFHDMTENDIERVTDIVTGVNYS